MSFLFRLAVSSALAATVLAHVDINYPLGSWAGTEDQQEDGGVCGGGSRVAAVAWGTQNPFISLSGDAGQIVRVLLASTNSTSADTSITDASSFPIVLSEGATFSSSGNLCLPLNIPGTYLAGSRATIYVEVSDAGNRSDDAVSACADVVLVPADFNEVTVVSPDGEDVINEGTGRLMTTFDYYCSNRTIAALDSCSCHCHGALGHCDTSCSAERVEASNAECAGTTGSPVTFQPSISSSASPSASSRPSSGSTAASGTVAPAATGSTSSATHIFASFGGTVALAVGMLALQ